MSAMTPDPPSLASPPSGRLRALRQRYPKLLAFATLVILAMLALDVAFLMRWKRYQDETERLRAGMTDAERRRADIVLASDKNRLGVMLELIRRQAQSDRGLHLSVSIDSGRMLLERDGALLRDMQVDVGAARFIGTPPDTVRVVPPQGARSVQRILGANDVWEVPRWVFTDRKLAVPDDRRMRGVLGHSAVVLNGGAVIYALPDSGVLADSSYILPGAVRLQRADLRAIAPNLSPGLTVYFYE